MKTKFDAFLGIAKAKCRSYLVTFVNFLFSGNFLLLILGIFFATWLNSLVTPEFVLLIGLTPLSLFSLPSVITSICILLFGIITARVFFKNLNATWFFAGASLTSFWFAMGSLFEVVFVWYINSGQYLPDLYVEYPMPAIYTVKLFRSVFFAALFGLLGHWVSILKRKEK